VFFFKAVTPVVRRFDAWCVTVSVVGFLCLRRCCCGFIQDLRGIKAMVMFFGALPILFVFIWCFSSKR